MNPKRKERIVKCMHKTLRPYCINKLPDTSFYHGKLHCT